VTELYLANLRKRLTGLEHEASVYKPYSHKENAPPVPEELALDMQRAQASITLYEQTLERTRNDQTSLSEAFEEDIVRFRELKRL
jgi:hypothetical protein